MERVRQRFVEEGLAAALSPYRGGKRIYARRLDGTQEAHLIALACSAPPEGRGRWTLRLLARRMVELPLAGWRHVAVTESRRRTDWALFIRSLLEDRYREADRVVLVMHQLNTHSPASLYEAFRPQEAKRLADRLEMHHTPKHGSWLNMAEVELSALARQCLSRRIARQDTLERRVAQWQADRNAAEAKVKWQFTTADAHVKLRTLYPSLHP